VFVDFYVVSSVQSVVSSHSIDLSQSGFLLKTGSSPRNGIHLVSMYCCCSCAMLFAICLISLIFVVFFCFKNNFGVVAIG